MHSRQLLSWQENTKSAFFFSRSTVETTMHKCTPSNASNRKIVLMLCACLRKIQLIVEFENNIKKYDIFNVQPPYFWILIVLLVILLYFFIHFWTHLTQRVYSAYYCKRWWMDEYPVTSSLCLPWCFLICINLCRLNEIIYSICSVTPLSNVRGGWALTNMFIPLHSECVYLKSEANSSVVRVVVVCSCMFVEHRTLC